MFTIQDILFFDVETSGLPPKGAEWETNFNLFPNIVSIAWLHGDIEKHFIVKPEGWVIPEEATAIHGITTEYALQHGVPIADVMIEFCDDAIKAPLICAHNIYFDSSMIKANILKFLGKQFYEEFRVEQGLHKGKRIDTMMKTIKFVGALYPNGGKGKFPKLEELFDKIFPGVKFDAHNALQDCVALRKCLPELIKLEIIKLEIKTYDSNPAPKASAAKKIEFNDPNQAIIPGPEIDKIPEKEKEVLPNGRRKLNIHTKR